MCRNKLVCTVQSKVASFIQGRLPQPDPIAPPPGPPQSCRCRTHHRCWVTVWSAPHWLHVVRWWCGGTPQDMTSPQIVLEVTQCGGRAQNGWLYVPVRIKMNFMYSREKKVKNVSSKHLSKANANVKMAVLCRTAAYTHHAKTLVSRDFTLVPRFI